MRQYEHTFEPDEADRIVKASNGYNFRQSDDTIVFGYAAAMTADQWRWEEANPIRLSEDGTRCSDGLHRLAACALSKTPMRAIVWRGDDAKAGLNTDRGRPRTPAQYLAHLGVGNASVLSQIARTHLARVAGYERKISTSHGSRWVTDEDIISFVTSNQALVSRCGGMGEATRQRGLSRVGYSVFVLEASLGSVPEAEQFHSDYINPDLQVNDPLRVLREYATRHWMEVGRAFGNAWTIENLIVAWNKRLTGVAQTRWQARVPDEVRFPDGCYPR